MRAPCKSLARIGCWPGGAGELDPDCADGPDALRDDRVFRNAPLQRIEWDGILRMPRTRARVKHYYLQGLVDYKLKPG